MRVRQTPLHALHVELGARMAPFAGYDMPIQYPTASWPSICIPARAAGLFDVSHMGQALLEGPDQRSVAAFLEALVSADILDLAPGRQRYTQFLNEHGGIVDDLMVDSPTRRRRRPAARRQRGAQGRRLRSPSRAPAGDLRLTPLDDAALIAIQGPLAAPAFARLAPGQALQDMPFMSARTAFLGDVETFVSRSGYTGEDGFEISLPAARADMLARALLTQPDVAPIGLGARDSLRLEAGLCLYGHELDESVDPIEASLAWSIQKRRRAEGGFPGVERIRNALANGPGRVRVGFRPDGRAPAREGAEIVSVDGRRVGVVTSGGFGPSVGAPIAMGFVDRAHSSVGAAVALVVRGKALNARVVAMPFHPHAYYRG